MIRRREYCFWVFVVLWLFSSPVHARNDVQAIGNAITELDVELARSLLEKVDWDSKVLQLERARLAIFLGDCDGAEALLAAPSLDDEPTAGMLRQLASSCARATAASLIVDDTKNGLWVRLQDDRDRVLVPLLAEVANRARASVAKDLGVELPRPLRIDLVRDLFSLSAVSGLPLTAAETTGTVAVARWGRVTMLSPRATTRGYPWADTLAHEIVHLALARGTRDRAPLWMQEGLAKRQETRWRPPRPFDGEPDPDQVSRRALLAGWSVGVNKLDPSIAMLPTPEAASTAYAEVTSFMRYWIGVNREPALEHLFVDLKGGVANPDSALRSVSGYDLEQWITRWERHLTEQVAEEREAGTDVERPHTQPGEVELRDASSRVRLGDLLSRRGHWRAAGEQLVPAVELAPRDPGVRWRAARAIWTLEGRAAAEPFLGTTEEIDSAHGVWLALQGRRLAENGKIAEAQRAFEHALALDPLREECACEGVWRTDKKAAVLPKGQARSRLCASARH